MATSKNQRTEEEMNLSFMSIRKAVGWLGISLPFALYLGALFVDQCSELKESISAYYYTVTGNVLTGILCAVALFLFTYKGYDTADRVFSIIAAVFGTGIAFFPTDVNPAAAYCNIVIKAPNPFSNTMHYVSAAIFFVSLACMSLFLFTQSDKNKEDLGPQKRKRNMVYRTCGIIMLCALASILSLQLDAVKQAIGKYKPEFIFETIALISFGISWLVKGETFLKDKPKEDRGIKFTSPLSAPTIQSRPRS